MTLTQEQAAAMLVDKTFQLMCYSKPSFSSDDIREACMALIEKEIARTQFITEIIGE